MSLFHTTHWSVVLNAAEGGQSALAELCEAYWPALFAFVLRKGYTVEDARDLTQSFFLELLEKEWIADADRERGRFRSFLLTAMQRFMLKDWRQRSRQKRGAGQLPLSLEAAEIRAQAEALSTRPEDSPERVFDRQWAATVLSRAYRRLQREAVAVGKEALIEAMKPFLIESATGEYAAPASALGMTQNAFGQAVKRFRQRYRESVRAEIEETVATQAMIEEEMAALLEILRAG